MKHFLLSLLILLFAGEAYSHYFIHAVTPGVQIESGKTTGAAEKGKEVKANEYIIIPEGGEIEIYNDLEKSIYKWDDAGKISVAKLMIDARKRASDNNTNVASRLRIAKSSSNTGEKVYVEKGMVRRSLEVFDPGAGNYQVDSKTLASQISRYLNGSDSTAFRDMAVDVKSGALDSIGHYFRIVNTLEFPIYFNVLKIGGNMVDTAKNVEISKLGQPDGSYVLLPGQAMTRESFSSLPDDERHLLIVTHFRYDLDEVVEETAKVLQNAEATPGDSLPILIEEIGKEG